MNDFKYLIYHTITKFSHSKNNNAMKFYMITNNAMKLYMIITKFFMITNNVMRFYIATTKFIFH